MQTDDPKKRPRVDGDIEGTAATFLIDSGASVSVMGENFLHKIAKHWDIRRLPLPPTLRVSGVTGHRIKIVDYIEAKINILGKEISRPLLVVRGIDNTEVLLGWDTCMEEGLVLDGETNQAYFKVRSTEDNWSVAAIATSRRITLLPRSVHKVEVVAMLNDSCVAPGEVGICESTLTDEIGMWDCITKVKEDGCMRIPIANLSGRRITLPAGQQVGVMRNPDRWDDVVRPLDDETIASIMGEIGQDPAEPSRGMITPISDQEKVDLISKLQIKADKPWKQRFTDLVVKYHDVCSKDKYDLGRASVIKHSIRVKDTSPTHARQFRIPFEHESVVHNYVDELLKQGAIEVSRSPYNSPIFCVTKKCPPDWPQGTPPPLRCVLDYRQINEKSLPDRYAIKEIREYIDAVGRNNSNVFSALDLTSGFWQQELEANSRQYTAFTVPGRSARYQWKVTPMGLQGSPASFARLMDHVMRGVNDCLTYIDDVLVHSRTMEAHLASLEEALLRLRRFGMKLNVQKSIFGAQQVQYLGYTISSAGVSPSDDKLRAIKECKPPQNVKQIREFVGLANYFRFLIKDFSRKATTLTALTRKDAIWKSGELPAAAQRAFSEIRDELCAQPVVAYPLRDAPFILHTDGATGDQENPGGLGAVLLQKQGEGPERVIAYASRALKDHEKNYSAYLLEMAAAVFGIEHFDVYLRGKKFTLYMDHKPLEKLSTIHTKTLNRLQQLMTEYTFETRYKPGPENSVADYLSRNVVAALTDESGSIKEAQDNDKKIADVKKFLKTKKLPKGDNTYVQWVRRIAQDCTIEEGLVWHNQVRKGYRVRKTILAPPCLHETIIQAAHAQLDAGHGGTDRTINRVLTQYWWPGVTNAVKKFVEKCTTCMTSKASRSKPAPLQSLPLCTTPNERCHIDLFGPLKVSQGGNKYIMVMTDAFTKFAEVVAIEDKTAETVARAFFERWICRFSAPAILMSDQGKEFCNHVLELVCELWGIEKMRTSSFHPETNSSAESYNRSMIKFMRATLENDRTTDWEDYLAPMSLSYNCHVHQATLESPFFLTYLHDPRLPHFDFNEPRKLYSNSYAAEAFNLAQAAHLRVRHNLGEQKRRQEDYFNKKAEEKSFQGGDKVIVHFPNVPKGVNPKFYTKWRLFTVDKMVGPTNVALREKPGSKVILVHINRTRKATLPETASTLPKLELPQETHCGNEMEADADMEENGNERAVSGAAQANDYALTYEPAPEHVIEDPIREQARRKGRKITIEAAAVPQTTRYNLRPRAGKQSVKFLTYAPPREYGSSDEEEEYVVTYREPNAQSESVRRRAPTPQQPPPSSSSSSSSSTSSSASSDDDEVRFNYDTLQDFAEIARQNDGNDGAKEQGTEQPELAQMPNCRVADGFRTPTDDSFTSVETHSPSSGSAKSTTPVDRRRLQEQFRADLEDVQDEMGLVRPAAYTYKTEQLEELLLRTRLNSNSPSHSASPRSPSGGPRTPQPGPEHGQQQETGRRQQQQQQRQQQQQQPESSKRFPHPDQFLRIAQRIMPSVRPATRSRGATEDVPLPKVCPTKMRELKGKKTGTPGTSPGPEGKSPDITGAARRPSVPSDSYAQTQRDRQELRRFRAEKEMKEKERIRRQSKRSPNQDSRDG
jgi:ribonuclease HI